MMKLSHESKLRLGVGIGKGQGAHDGVRYTVGR